VFYIRERGGEREREGEIEKEGWREKGREREREGNAGVGLWFVGEAATKGIYGLLFDYRLTVKQGILKELLLRLHSGPYTVSDTSPRDLFHTVLR